jgi:hypothetical protein
LLDLY